MDTSFTALNKTFKATSLPDWLTSATKEETDICITWSDSFREVLEQLTKLDGESLLPRPVQHLLDRPPPYDRCLALPEGSSELAEPLVEALRHFVCTLTTLRITNRLIIMNDLIGERVSAHAISYLMAYFQTYIASLSNGRLGATYAPLSHTGENSTPFPLHADLYPQKNLFMIYNNVPNDSSGKTLLLPIRKFFEIVQETEGVPKEVALSASALLQGNHHDDSFTKFFSLLYGRGSIWRETLIHALRTHCLEQKFPSGTGVILNDRVWLHGRSKPTNGVPIDRLFRLAFDTSV